MGEFRQGGANRFSGWHGGHGGGFKGRGGRPNFGGNKGGFCGNDRGPVVMHKVVCDECKKPCEVPFMPTAGKPVYCSSCFDGRREGNNSRGGNSFARNSGDYKTPPRTDFGNDINKVSGNEIKKQIELLNTKVDKLLKSIEDFINSKSQATPLKKETLKTSIVKVVTKKAPVKKISKKVSKK